MAKLPSEEAVRARATESGRVPPDAEIDRVTRRSIMADLLKEAQQDERARGQMIAGASPVLPIASIDVQLPDIGLMHIVVTLTPPKENPQHGQ
jgi:hypothetical protein